MLQLDPNLPMTTQKLGKSLRTLGIMGLIIPFIRFFFRLLITSYVSTYYSEEDLNSYIQGFIVQYRAYYISDLLFFAISAIFTGFFLFHLFRFASLFLPLSLPNIRSFKTSAILFLVALIGNGLLSIFYGIFIESSYRQLLYIMLFGGDIDTILSGLMFLEFLIILLYCIPSLLYLIGYSIFKKSDGVFHQLFPYSPYSSRIPYTVLIIGAAIAFVADLILIPGYFNDLLTLLAMLMSFAGYLTLNIGLIIVGSRIIGLIPVFQGASPYPSVISQPPSQNQPPAHPYLSYTFSSNPSTMPTNSPTTVMPPENIPLPPKTLFCSRCGKLIPADSTFCMHCGNLLPKPQ